MRVALVRADGRFSGPALDAGDIDLLFVPPGSLAPHIMVRRVLSERFACVLRRGHPAAAAPLDLDAFCALDHLLVSPDGAGFSGAVDAALAGLGRRRRVMLSVQDFLVAPRIIAQTDLIATMHTRLLAGFPETLAILPPPLDLSGFGIDMAWHPRTQADPAQHWLRTQAAEVAAGL